MHAIDRLQGIGLPIDFNRGSLKDNITLCRLHRIPGWADWWARTLAIDAIIGNSDRHTENWGFLVNSKPNGADYMLAPAFDNGTSLGFIIGDPHLRRFMEPARLAALIRKGAHHFGWAGGDHSGAQHARLCATYRNRVAISGNAMEEALSLSDIRIQRIVDWCCSFSFPLPFLEERGQFVAAQVRGRRDALAAALGA